MEQKTERKRNYALLLVHRKEDGTTKEHVLSLSVICIVAILLLALAIAAVCRLAHDSIVIKDARKEIVDQIVVINDLTDENEALSVENSTLSSKIAVLSETVSMKVEAEDALSQEVVENALPKGFPLSGSATMKEAEEGTPMLIFTAVNGVNVITSGTGTVVSVDVDETYGTRIVVDHGNGYQSIYRNGGTALVRDGEELGKGYILFAVKKDNLELGYQIMYNDQYIDPMTLIDING